MNDDVTVCIGTFGDVRWPHLARSRAIPSASKLIDADRVIHEHRDTLHEARNACLERVTTERACFLDADDELHPGFFDAMRSSTADVRAPSVCYVRNGVKAPARMPKVAGHTHSCTDECLPYGNWLVIGSLVLTDVARAVGGFRDFDWSEDWDLWVRCWQAGATIEAVPSAVYVAHVSMKSRNRGTYTREQKLESHRAIARANGLPVP